MSVQVSVLLASEPQPTADPAVELAGILRGIEVDVEAVFEDSGAPVWLTVEAVDKSSAERVVDRLIDDERIEAVFIKPPDELPL